MKKEKGHELERIKRQILKLASKIEKLEKKGRYSDADRLRAQIRTLRNQAENLY